MKPKPHTKSKLTDAERHKRFVEVAKKVEASDSQEDLDSALQNLVKKPHKHQSPKNI
jgi:hypothetical protein